MRKLIVFLMLIFVYETYGQESSIGPTIGYNHAWMSGDNQVGRPGFNVGVIYNHSFQEHWGFGAGLLYSLEGAKIETTDGLLNATYLRVPLRVVYYFGNYGNAFRPKVYLGPSLAFLLGSKLKVNDLETDVIDNYEKFDFGILGGVGFNYRLKEKTWLNFDLGYTHGLVDQLKLSTTEQTNQLINANIGVAFGF